MLTSSPLLHFFKSAFEFPPGATSRSGRWKLRVVLSSASALLALSPCLWPPCAYTIPTLGKRLCDALSGVNVFRGVVWRGRLASSLPLSRRRDTRTVVYRTHLNNQIHPNHTPHTYTNTDRRRIVVSVELRRRPCPGASSPWPWGVVEVGSEAGRKANRKYKEEPAWAGEEGRTMFR